MTDEAPSAGQAAFEAAVDKANAERWWTDHQNLYTLLTFLDGPNPFDECVLDLALAIDIVEKPWNWTDEFVTAMSTVDVETQDEREAQAEQVEWAISSLNSTRELTDSEVAAEEATWD